MLGLVRSFRYAFAGLAFLLRTQRNFRVEAALGAVAVALGVWLGLSPAEWSQVAVVIALVLALEGLNTSLELTVDLASPRIDPRARAAKDVAAAMVLVAALASIAVALALFVPRLANRLAP